MKNCRLSITPLLVVNVKLIDSNSIINLKRIACIVILQTLLTKYYILSFSCFFHSTVYSTRNAYVIIKLVQNLKYFLHFARLFGSLTLSYACNVTVDIQINGNYDVLQFIKNLIYDIPRRSYQKKSNIYFITILDCLITNLSKYVTSNLHLFNAFFALFCSKEVLA